MLHKERILHNKIRRGLQRTGLKAKKWLGQNFLVDETVRDTIINAGHVSADDTIVEVGPGLGVLTEILACLARRVVAVEIDNKLASRLSDKLSRFSNLEIINADILQVDLRSVLGTETGCYKVIANIPYYITSPILRYFTRMEARPSLMVIMMQDEVAADLTSKPGHMTFLAVSMQIFSRIEIVCKVPAASFYPVPKVNSAVVKFEMLDNPLVPLDDVDGFLELVRAGFSAPRKQLRNSLSLGLKLDPPETVNLLEKSCIDPQRRPGTLTIEEWWQLYLNRGNADA